MKSILTKDQKQHHVKVVGDHKHVLHLCYDDECGNGHNTFSVTVDTYMCRQNRWYEEAFGCQHDVVREIFPEFAHLIKWHLCSSDGPMHYPTNALYHAGDRDCWGLRKGEAQQIRNGKTGQLCWELVMLDTPENPPKYVHSDTQPAETYTMAYRPWCRTGEGKEPDLDAARSCAVAPDATLEQLQDKAWLEARLPGLLEEFKRDMESIGFVF